MIKQVGKYVLERELGRGAMGSVWLSNHPGLGIPVAVKILDEYLAAQDPDFYNRFVKEGSLAASINHQNVVRVYDAGRDGNTFFLVMELVDGKDAGILLKEKGMLILDFMNCNKVIQNLTKKESKMIDSIRFNIKKDYINGYIVKNIDFNTANKSYHFQEKVKAISLTDFKNYFEKANLKMEAIFGDYDLNSFDVNTSDRLIMIVKK
ncbi:MAG: protein kinase, partial [Flavobacteriales bacterium]|nr:protein kinase [Flavobacteriales bacterium]